MNKLIVSLLVAASFAAVANAAEIKIGWDAVPGPETTFVVKSWHFIIDEPSKKRVRTAPKQSFPSVTGLVQDINLPVGEHLLTVQAVWTAPPPSTGNIESDFSNDLYVLVPPAPGNLKIVQSPVANGMRLVVYGDKAKRVVLYRDNGNGKWKKIHTFKDFNGQGKFVDKNWTKKKDFKWKVEVEKA